MVREPGQSSSGKFTSTAICLRNRSMEKQHYYSLTFSAGQDRMGSVYIGYNDQSVSYQRLIEAKQAAGMPLNSVVIAVCYLGYMTGEEMRPADTRPKDDDSDPTLSNSETPLKPDGWIWGDEYHCPQISKDKPMHAVGRAFIYIDNLQQA